MNARFRQICRYAAALLVGVAVGLLVMRRDREPLPATERRESPADALPPGLALPRPPAAPREFAALSAEGRELLSSLIRRFGTARDDGERLAVLDEIEARCLGRDVVGLARSVFEAGPDECGRAVCERVLELLSGQVSADILPVLELARRHGDESQRTLAVQAAAQVRDAAVEPFVASFFADPEKNVRLAALEVAGQLPGGTRERLFSRALQAPARDVALGGLGELEVDATAATLPLIFDGLAAPDPEVRAETRHTLDFLLDETFDTPQAAAAWWEANRHRFDAQLIRVE